MPKIKTNEIPHDAKHLYIQLYCERKGGKTEENLSAASQSWLSLSIAKKQHFRDTISTKHAIVTAQRIIKTKPYLKEINPSNSNKRKRSTAPKRNKDDIGSHPYDTTTENLETIENDDRIECENFSISFANEDSVDPRDEAASETSALGTGRVIQEKCGLEQRDDVSLEAENNTIQEVDECLIDKTQTENTQIDKEKNQPNIQEDDTSSSEESIKTKDAEYVPLPEPLLPVVTKGKDLFELLKTRNGQSQKSYESLTTREKKFYATALCAIKRDYVKKYKLYLESLPARQLFDHYMKVLE